LGGGGNPLLKQSLEKKSRGTTQPLHRRHPAVHGRHGSIQDLKPFHEEQHKNAEKFQLKSVHAMGDFTRSLDGEWYKY